jgi:pyruvate/2-oxoglutarate dehydrogenase complex dihydrolipoamide acyltransferase (E2) component
MATSIVMPRLGDFMMEGIVVSWAKSQGEAVSQGEVIAEIETEKLNYDLEATDGGFLHPVVPEGATVAVDGLLGYVLAVGEAPPAVEAPEPAQAVAPPATGVAPRAAPRREAGAQVASTPGARRLAAKLGVELADVTPTGPRGRVTDADVRAHAEQRTTADAPVIPSGLPEPSRTEPMKGMRKSIADHMKGSLSATAQLSYFLEVDVTEAQRLRRESSGKGETTLGMPHVLIMASAQALRRVPALNSVLAGDSVLYFDRVDIGLAVGLADGLVVPVVRDVGAKDIYTVAEEVRELVDKAKSGKLLPDDMAGGTFTISVLGTVDGFTPILNRGQSGILGAGRTSEKPVVRDGEVVSRETMTLSLTADHQVIDGEVAASFMRRLQQAIERPAPLFKRLDT